MPRRGALATAKTAVAVAGCLVLSLLMVLAGLAGAWAESRHRGASVMMPGLATLAGELLLPVTAGLLAHTVATLARSAVVALVGVLGWVLVASPLLAATTRAARWLPDQAARQVSDHAAHGLSSGGALAVVMGWLVLANLLAVWRLVRADA